MNNLLKTASQELSSNDIIKTASILRKLKNKFLNLFDSQRRDDVEKLLNKTQSIKPLLGDTYKKIKEIEESINDLDVDSYNKNISELKELISKLDKEMSKLDTDTIKNEELKTEKTTNQKSPAKGGRARSDFPQDYISKYYEKDGIKLKTLQEVGANIGVDIKFGTNIVPTRNFLMPFFSNMAQMMFVGNAPLKDVSYPIKPQQYNISSEEFLELEKQVSKSELERILYEAMPTFPIKGIFGRELRTSGEKKQGIVEIKLSPTEGGWIKLPQPMENYVVKIDFILVDKGDPAQPYNYQLYRQTVQAVKELYGKK
jgi:hypothetical protein